MSLARVQFFSVSLDGFGTGEGLTLDAPFGAALGVMRGLQMLESDVDEQAAGYLAQPAETASPDAELGEAGEPEEEPLELVEVGSDPVEEVDRCPVGRPTPAPSSA